MTDIAFGDSVPEDAFSAESEQADPLQVAIRLHDLQRDLLALDGQDPLVEWHELDEEEQAVGFQMAALMTDWLQREGTTV